MPLHRVEGLDIGLPDYSYSETHWRNLGQAMKSQFGESLFENPEDVIKILTASYEYLINLFEQVVHSEQRISYYIFCNYLHENSLALKQKFDLGLDFPFNQQDFVYMRRSLKLVLEQSVIIDFRNENNYEETIRTNYEEYCQVLEEHLYLASKAFEFSEYIAHVKLDPEHFTADLRYDFNFPLRYPNHEVLSKLIRRMADHENDIVDRLDWNGLFSAIETDTGIPREAISVLFSLMDHLPDGAFRLQIPGNLYHGISQMFGISAQTYQTVLDGFILRISNVLTIGDSIYRSNSMRRFLNRPILELNVCDSDGAEQKLWLLGKRKYAEALYSLFRSHLPWGEIPEEWRVFPTVLAYTQKLRASNDVYLEQKFCSILEQCGMFFDSKVTSLKTKNNRNISLVKRPNDIGDIDILAVSAAKKEIYVCEAKHLKARYDIKNWYHDILHFKKHHEQQLTRKWKWVCNNIQSVQNHFDCLYKEQSFEFQAFKVLPVFLINNPTLYMYDSPFLCLTLHEFGRFIEDDYQEYNLTIPAGRDGETVVLSRPFFSNLRILDKALFDNM